MTIDKNDPDWLFAVETMNKSVKFRILDKVNDGSHYKLNKDFLEYYLKAVWDKSEPSILDAEGTELPLQDGIQVVLGEYLFKNGFQVTDKELFSLAYNIATSFESELADPRKEFKK